MHNFLRTIAVALACAALALSCASGRNGMGRGTGPSKAEMTLMRLKDLLQAPALHPSSAITQEQAAQILPILEEWKSAASSISSSKASSYAADVDAVLTEEQLKYRSEARGRDGPPPQENDGGQRMPPPGQGGPGGQSGPGGPGGPGGSEDRTASLLDELIEKLSDL